MAERYFKRYRMKFDCRQTSIPDPVLPSGFSWVPWSMELLEAHALVKSECFRNEVDASIFPCLGNLAGCRKLMWDISGQPNFLPAATWLIQHPSDFPGPRFCGTIQGMTRAFRIGAIQNVGITTDCRGLGLGKSLVARALIGFAEFGVQRVYLDVTAANIPAVNLYERIGFRIESTSYQTVKLPQESMELDTAPPMPGITTPTFG